MLVTCRPRASMPRAQRTTTLTRSAARSTHGIELGPLLGVHLLGVVQAGEGAAVGVGERLVVDQHRRGDQRAGEAAAAGLVGAGDPAAVEAAVEAKRRRVRARRRWWSLPFAAGLEDADAVRGPVGGKGLADDPSRGTGPQKRLSSLSPRLSPIMK